MLAVCATPIGNLEDVTFRVLDELRAAELVLCEDTRRTRIPRPRSSAAVSSASGTSSSATYRAASARS
jgi:hypothetical protein